jgi:2-haloacid dehalogenase
MTHPSATTDPAGAQEVLVFDVNETLLDLRALAPRFELLLPATLMGQWFSQMLRNSLVASLTGSYASFDRQGVDALLATARSAGVVATEAQAEDVVAGMNELPPHPDVLPALQRLAAAGYRMATLTNSAAAVVIAQIRNAGLSPFFERLLSVDEIQVFKPAPETYRYAAAELDVPIDRIRLVAAHDWDVTGAIRAGARAAFVARRGAVLGPLSETPDIIEPDLAGVADAMLKERPA